MPQMSPLMWFFLMNITIILLMMTSSINYFSKKAPKAISSKAKAKQTNWTW